MYLNHFSANIRSLIALPLSNGKVGVPVVCLPLQVATIYRYRQSRQLSLHQV